MTKKQFFEIATSVITAVALILIAFGVLAPDDSAVIVDNEPTARGVSNFDDITLSGSLNVGGALDVTGASTFGSSNMYPLLTDSASQGIYVGQSTITGTATIAAGTHSLSAVTAAFCTLGQSPATGAGAPALCWTSFTTTTVTITVEQDDWTSNATSGAIVNYAIVGTP